jgi:hypothetical protein
MWLYIIAYLYFFFLSLADTFFLLELLLLSCCCFSSFSCGGYQWSAVFSYWQSPRASQQGGRDASKPVVVTHHDMVSWRHVLLVAIAVLHHDNRAWNRVLFSSKSRQEGALHHNNRSWHLVLLLANAVLHHNKRAWWQPTRTWTNTMIDIDCEQAAWTGNVDNKSSWQGTTTTNLGLVHCKASLHKIGQSSGLQSIKEETREETNAETNEETKVRTR